MHRTAGGPARSLVVTVLTALIAVTPLAGCQTYEPEPLAPDEILDAAQLRRHVEPATDAVTLARAVELTRQRSPNLLPLRESAATAQALADMGTPLPNPTLGAGPLLLSGPDVTSSTRWGVEVVGGWLLDIAGSRSAATSVREAEALVASNELAATERETYLSLRRAFIRHTAARRHSATVLEVAASAGRSLGIVNRLVEAAQATALDVDELAVEVHMAAADAVEAREMEAEARAEISALTGVDAARWLDLESPALPAAEPTRDALIDALLRGHPELDRLRTEHALAEAGLRAEITAQFPGIELEPGYEYEEKTDTYSLGLGFEVPLFDRNQIGIAAAEGRRREVRARFEATVQTHLGLIDAGITRLAHRAERLRILTEQAAPAARDGLALAEGALRSGALDGLRYLTVARTEREVRLAVVAAEQAVFEAWCDLEVACGAPLLSFASVAAADADRPESQTPSEGEDR